MYVPEGHEHGPALRNRLDAGILKSLAQYEAQTTLDRNPATSHKCAGWATMSN